MRCTILLVLLIASGCATTPPANDYSSLYDGRSTTAFVTEFPAGSADEAIARGDHAYSRGELDRALYLYLQAIEADPDRTDAFFRVGIVHEQRGKLELAANAFRYVLARDPDDTAANEKLGLVLLGQRDPDQAKSHLEKAYALDPGRWRTVNGLGVIADLEGEHWRAADYFREALALDPKSPKILTNLGYSLYLADDWAQAEQILLQALEQAPDYELALRNLALLHSRRGDAAQALKLLLKVTGEAQAHNDVGYLCLIEGNYSLAATYFRRAVELSPSYYELAHRNLKRAQELSRLSDRSSRSTQNQARQAQVHTETVPAKRPATGPAPQPTTKPAARPDTKSTPKPAPKSNTKLNKTLFADQAGAGDPVRAEPVMTARQAPMPVAYDSQAVSGAASERPLYLKRWVNAGVLNVRDDDDPGARLLDRLKRGRVVRVLRLEDGWAYVRYWDYKDDNIATREGWVHSAYLTDTRQRV